MYKPWVVSSMWSCTQSISSPITMDEWGVGHSLMKTIFILCKKKSSLTMAYVTDRRRDAHTWCPVRHSRIWHADWIKKMIYKLFTERKHRSRLLVNRVRSFLPVNKIQSVEFRLVERARFALMNSVDIGTKLLNCEISKFVYHELNRCLEKLLCEQVSVSWIQKIFIWNC